MRWGFWVRVRSFWMTIEMEDRSFVWEVKAVLRALAILCVCRERGAGQEA